LLALLGPPSVDRFAGRFRPLFGGHLSGAGGTATLADMLFATAYKVYVGFSARRFTSDLKDAQMRGLIGKAAHFNSVNRYIANPELTEALKTLVTVSSLPLKAAESDFAVDSSGFSSSRFVRWYNKKYGREVDNRMWVKVHLMCGVHTKIVSSVEVSSWTVHDTNYFVPLVEATAEHFQLRDVSADKAYLSRKYLKAVEELGGTPFVPFKSNTLEPTTEEEAIWAKMYYFMYNRLTFMDHYHMRSNVESTFSMLKGKFGDSVRVGGDKPEVEVGDG
jgi:transposase